jgi:DNA-binding NarL/FixJ family response regulator
VDGSPQTLAIAVVASDELRQRCHRILARARGRRVQSRGVGFAGASQLLRRYRPSVLLLDAVVSPLQALGILPNLRRLSPTTGVILLSGDRTPTAVVLEGLRRGASGYLTERDLSRHLSKAVCTVASGEPWVPRRLGAAIVAELRAAHQASNGRQRTRFRLIRGGLPPAASGIAP